MTPEAAGALFGENAAPVLQALASKPSREEPKASGRHLDLLLPWRNDECSTIKRYWSLSCLCAGPRGHSCTRPGNELHDLPAPS